MPGPLTADIRLQRNDMRAVPCDWPDVFPGGVPGWVIFGMQANDIRQRVTREYSASDTRGNDLCELSLIGLVAYFEGFVRYHFASCTNICPHLLSRFSRARPEVAIPLRDIAETDTIHGCIGFILADELEFTSPKEINAQFRDLLGITPFSKDESATYNSLLHDRHQIVHSAGMFTAKYIRTRKHCIPAAGHRAYMDSVVITPARVIEAADFFLKITEKLVRAADSCLSDPTNWHSAEEMAAMDKPRRFFNWTTDAFGPEQEEAGE